MAACVAPALFPPAGSPRWIGDAILPDAAPAAFFADTAGIETGSGVSQSEDPTALPVPCGTTIPL
jgi:hypothetical protein